MRRAATRNSQGTDSSCRHLGPNRHLRIVRENTTGVTYIPRMWRVSHLARRLGVSRQWVYRWIKDGRIRCYRLFNAVLLRETDVLKLLREQGIPLEKNSQDRGR